MPSARARIMDHFTTGLEIHLFQAAKSFFEARECTLVARFQFLASILQADVLAKLPSAIRNLHISAQFSSLPILNISFPKFWAENKHKVGAPVEM